MYHQFVCVSGIDCLSATSISSYSKYLLMKISWELNFSFQDLLVDRHGIIVVEGVNTGQHLVGQDAHSPPVDWLTMAFIKEHFWGEVLGGTTESICARLTVFGEAEICEF